ncbi:MAG TPA: ABC transporter ATP-binding protein [Firmicutes bacterium]|nr:ABC transporter ATP-binding protein [Bacillota bacterium]
MLEVKQLKIAYDGVTAVHEANFNVKQNEIVAIVGSNGAGKTTILNTIIGSLNPVTGDIIYHGENITGLPSFKRVQKKIGYVPEGRRLLGRLSVMDNLMLGGITLPNKEEVQSTLQAVFNMFPVLEERKYQKAGTLSGGEQQMVAIGRALMFKPDFLMMDEPSLGLMPKFVSMLFDVIKKINQEQGVTILIVEQKVRETLELANRGYVLQTGRIIMEGTGEELLESPLIRKAYLGL